jgi:hypothetical protein
LNEDEDFFSENCGKVDCPILEVNGADDKTGEHDIFEALPESQPKITKI